MAPNRQYNADSGSFSLSLVQYNAELKKMIIGKLLTFKHFENC